MEYHNFYRFRVVDSHWICVDSDVKNDLGITLADLFYTLGINIPDYIKYCLIETSTLRIKFREFKSSISIYVSLN